MHRSLILCAALAACADDPSRSSDVTLSADTATAQDVADSEQSSDSEQSPDATSDAASSTSVGDTTQAADDSAPTVEDVDAGPDLATLSVDLGGLGAVTVSGHPSCASACALKLTPGTTVQLEAKPQLGSHFVRWSAGPCEGSYRFCEVRVDDDVTVSATFQTQHHNLVFVSSVALPTTLGSTFAYTDQCNTLATAAGINNTTGDGFIALVSDLTHDARGLISSGHGWMRLDGKPFANRLNDFIWSPSEEQPHEIFYPIALDENGARVSGHVHTGFYSTPEDYNCNGWTDASARTTTTHTHHTGMGWHFGNTGLASCAVSRPVLCFGTWIAPSAISVEPVDGKRVWLTRTAWSPGAGLADADAKCQAEAPDGAMSARALLVGDERTFATLLDADALYVRPDGVPIGLGADIVSGLTDEQVTPALESAITTDADGQRIAPALWDAYAWTGTATRCASASGDWTSTSAAATGTIGDRYGWACAGTCGDFACDTSQLLRCVEE